MLAAGVSSPPVRRLCLDAIEGEYRSACIPSKFITTYREVFPTLKLSTVVNYPYGLHDVDVVLREIQGVVGILEKLEDCEINVVCPPEFYSNLDIFAQWNYLVPLKLIIPWTKLMEYIKLIPENVQKYPAFSALSFIRPGSQVTYKNHNAQVQTYIAALKQKGYHVKMAGYFKDASEMNEFLDLGVDSFGTSNVELLKDSSYGHQSTPSSEMQDLPYADSAERCDDDGANEGEAGPALSSLSVDGA